MSYSFNEFLSLLPDCDKFPTTDTKPNSVEYQSQRPDSFVPPSLSINNELSGQNPHNAPVIIISAPGAVGKSTVGKAIAFNKNVLFWDLATAGEVGSNSLDGMLLSTIGAQRIAEFNEYFTEGFQFLVIDALDEGRIKVTENSFRQLLQNISKLAKGSSFPRFVLLGRTRIAEEAWLVLNEEKIEASIFSIEPFNRTQANTFIANKSGKDFPLYNECRDLIFNRLEISIRTDSTTVSTQNNDFLHYPPVLDVVSTLLKDESNPMSLKNELENQVGTIGKPSVLLQKVISRILDREKQKMIQNIKGLLEEKASQENWAAWDTLYENNEQCKRLLASVLHLNITATPSTLPNVLKSEYENAISPFFQDHPFLQSLDSFANTVFQSYLYASALQGNYGHELNTFVTELLLKREHFPIGLLADFYFSDTFSEQGAHQKLNPAHLGILYGSLLSAESTQRYVRLNLDGPEPNSNQAITETVLGSFEFLWHESQDIREIKFQMEITDNSVISFSRDLRDAFITVPCTVEFGHNASEFQIGPAVQVNARTIKINSESLIVGGITRLRPQEEDANAVILEALVCESAMRRPPTIYYDTSKLFVVWPGSEAFPWTDFSAERPQAIFGDNQKINDVYRRFRKIVTEFRSHGKGSLARNKEIIDHRFVLQGVLGETLLKQLVNDQILISGVGTNHSLYFWNTEKANSIMNVTWQDLRQWAMTETLREYLSKFIQEHPELF